MIIINAQTKKQREKLIGRELKDILWLQTMDTWESEVFYFFFFPFNRVDWDWGFTSNHLIFSPQYMGGGWAMAKVFAFKEDREKNWIFQGRRRIGTKETVCLQFWWLEYGEGTDECRKLYDLRLQTLLSISLYSKPLFSLYFGRLDLFLYWVVLNSVLV